MIQFACDAFWLLIGVLCCAATIVIAVSAAKMIYRIFRNK